MAPAGNRSNRQNNRAFSRHGRVGGPAAAAAAVASAAPAAVVTPESSHRDGIGGGGGEDVNSSNNNSIVVARHVPQEQPSIVTPELQQQQQQQQQNCSQTVPADNIKHHPHRQHHHGHHHQGHDPNFMMMTMVPSLAADGGVLPLPIPTLDPLSFFVVVEEEKIRIPSTTGSSSSPTKITQNGWLYKSSSIKGSKIIFNLLQLSQQPYNYHDYYRNVLNNYPDDEGTKKKEEKHDGGDDSDLNNNHDNSNSNSNNDNDMSLSTHVEAYINNNIYNYNPYRVDDRNNNGEFGDLCQVREAFLGFVVSQGQRHRQGRGQDTCHAILQTLKVVASRIKQQQVELDHHEKMFWYHWNNNDPNVVVDNHINNNGTNMNVGGDRGGCGYPQPQQRHHHHQQQQQNTQQYPPPFGPTGQGHGHGRGRGHGIIPTMLFPSSANTVSWSSASAQQLSSSASSLPQQPPPGFANSQSHDARSGAAEESTGTLPRSSSASSSSSLSTAVAANGGGGGGGGGGKVMTATAMETMKMMNQQANMSYQPPAANYNSNGSSYQGHGYSHGHGHGSGGGGGGVAQGWVVGSYQYGGVQHHNQQQHQPFQPYYQEHPHQHPHPPHEYPSMPMPMPMPMSNGNSGSSIGNGSGPTMMFSPYYIMASNTFHEVRRLHRFFFGLANEGLMILKNNGTNKPSTNRHENDKNGYILPTSGDSRGGKGSTCGGANYGSTATNNKYNPSSQGRTNPEKGTTKAAQSKNTGRGTNNGQNKHSSSPSPMPSSGQAPVQNPKDMKFLLSDGFKVSSIQDIDEIYQRIGLIPVADWKPRQIGDALGLKEGDDVRTLSHEIGQNILHALYKRRVFQTNKHVVGNIKTLVGAGILSNFFLCRGKGGNYAKQGKVNRQDGSRRGTGPAAGSNHDKIISFRHDIAFTEASIHWILIFFLDIASSEFMTAKAAKWNLENNKYSNKKTEGTVVFPVPPFRPVYDDSTQHPFWKHHNGKPSNPMKKKGVVPTTRNAKGSSSSKDGATGSGAKKENLIEAGTSFGPTPKEAFRGTE